MTGIGSAFEPHFVWSNGGVGRFAAVEGEAAVLSSTVPAPPGARVEGELVSEASSARSKFRFKSHGSKREPDGTFTIRGRLIDATRALRESLEVLANAHASKLEGSDSTGTKHDPAAGGEDLGRDPDATRSESGCAAADSATGGVWSGVLLGSQSRRRSTLHRRTANVGGRFGGRGRVGADVDLRSGRRR